MDTQTNTRRQTHGQTDMHISILRSATEDGVAMSRSRVMAFDG